MKNKALYMFVAVATLIVLAGLGIIFISSDKTDEGKVAEKEDGEVAGVTSGENSIDKTELAKYLSQKGAVLYGSAYCGHCKKQKELFGDAFQYIDYVECGDSADANYNATECEANDIVSIPTWIYQSQKYVGQKTIEELAEIVGYEEEKK